MTDADLVRLRRDVESGDRRPAGVGAEQRREHADRGRLARAIGAEQAEHGAFVDGEVEAVERAHLALRAAAGTSAAVDLDEALGDDGLPVGAVSDGTRHDVAAAASGRSTRISLRAMCADASGRPSHGTQCSIG